VSTLCALAINTEINRLICMVKIIDLKKDLETLSEKNCIEDTQDSIDFSLYELLGRNSPLETIVGLSSAVINVTEQYVANKQHVINILQNVIAQLEADKLRETGKSLN